MPVSSPVVARRAIAAVGVALGLGCVGAGPASEPGGTMSGSPPMSITVALDRLACVSRNDPEGADDEVYVIASWTGSEVGERRVPGDRERWRMCGRDEFEPATLVATSIPSDQALTLSVEVGEDDSQAERVSNQIDDTLSRLTLVFSAGETGSVRVDATPHPVEDNNAVGLPPSVDVEVDQDGRRLTFTSAYRNAYGDVRYEGTLSW